MSTKFVLTFYFGDERPSVYTFEPETSKESLNQYLTNVFYSKNRVFGMQTIHNDEKIIKVYAGDFELETLDEWFQERQVNR